MDKKNIFWILITAILAIIILFVCVKLIFKSDSVNEGKFRLTDFIITSTAEVANKNNQNGNWSIDLSQKNKLSMLITAAADAEIVDVSLKNITVNKQNVSVFQEDKENIVMLEDTGKELKLEYKLDKNNQLLIELIVLNESILKNWSIPQGTNEIIYDGRIFKTAGMSLKDIQFRFRCNLVITENTGRENVLKVDLKLPFEELLQNGADVRRLNASEFKFKVS